MSGQEDEASCGKALGCHVKFFCHCDGDKAERSRERERSGCKTNQVNQLWDDLKKRPGTTKNDLCADRVVSSKATPMMVVVVVVAAVQVAAPMRPVASLAAAAAAAANFHQNCKKKLDDCVFQAVITIRF